MTEACGISYLCFLIIVWNLAMSYYARHILPWKVLGSLLFLSDKSKFDICSSSTVRKIFLWFRQDWLGTVEKMHECLTTLDYFLSGKLILTADKFNNFNVTFVRIENLESKYWNCCWVQVGWGETKGLAPSVVGMLKAKYSPLFLEFLLHISNCGFGIWKGFFSSCLAVSKTRVFFAVRFVYTTIYLD